MAGMDCVYRIRIARICTYGRDLFCYLAAILSGRLVWRHTQGAWYGPDVCNPGRSERSCPVLPRHFVWRCLGLVPCLGSGKKQRRVKSKDWPFVDLTQPTQIFVWIITAPLHLIPVVGTAIACYINGWPAWYRYLYLFVACAHNYAKTSSFFNYSWGHHLHYDIEFRGFSVSESRRFAWRNRASYCNFGAVAVALELVPLFNLLFMWTNVVGAALWVADKYEKNEAEIAKQQRRQQQQQNASGNTSIASIYPSHKSPSSFVPSIDSEQGRLLYGSTTKDGYGSTTEV